ncbi:hypothetical protein M8J75_016619, partial [Diaphorina citri]
MHSHAKCTPPHQAVRCYSEESVGEDGVKAELTISGTEPGDGGAYFCQASNVYGKDQQLVQLLVQ